MRKMPVLLTFDVDGEMIWRCRDPENADRPVTLSLGHYGLDRGLPRILKVLKKYDAPATFFVPGMTAEMFPYTATVFWTRGFMRLVTIATAIPIQTSSPARRPRRRTMSGPAGSLSLWLDISSKVIALLPGSSAAIPWIF